MLDFHFWGVTQSLVLRCQSQDLNSLLECLQQFADTYDVKMFRKAAVHAWEERSSVCDVTKKKQ